MSYNDPVSEKQTKNKKVALGLSGGVDSSVAALLLLQQGYDVTGVYMQCWDIKSDGCAADEDKAYALQVAAKLGIKFIHLDFKDVYKDKVIEYFYEEYRRGNTPNPDVMCNKEIKFGIFYDWAMKEGYDFVATGHYARVSGIDNDVFLLKGLDAGKDQSYFLYLLDRERLSKTLLPLGDLQKSEVRRLAKQAELPTAVRPDSMGICFVGEVDIKDFLKARLDIKPGFVLDKEGTVIGDHDGAWFYTIGQRHGFRVKKYSGHPMYVIRKNVTDNTLVVGFESDVITRKFNVSGIHWINADPFLEKSKSISVDVRVRHLGIIVGCTIELSNEGKVAVTANENLFGVASGQSAVFYKGDIVLGGGVIEFVQY